MKKYKIGILCALIIAGSILLSGCFSNKYYNLSVNKLAENRHNLYYGENESVETTLITGTRESDYVINGYCTQSIEFGVVTFKLLASVEFAGNPLYSLTVGTTRYDGALEQNPFDGTYVADVKTLINSTEKIIAKLMMGDFVQEIELVSVTSNWQINYDQALEIACKELKSDLEGFMDNGEFAGEVYVKIINDDDVDNKVYYWYVNFVNRSGKNVAVIIDPNTKEILAKKNM